MKNQCQTLIGGPKKFGKYIENLCTMLLCKYLREFNGSLNKMYTRSIGII